jgi:hypothetical protein
MKLRSSLLLAVAVATLFAAVPSAEARGRKQAAVLEPGKYKNWGPDIDEVEIVNTFRTSDYDKIVVLPFDTSKTPLPDSGEDAYPLVKNVLAGYSNTLTEALRSELKAKADIDQATRAPRSARTLIVRGSVDSIDPGSRAKRYLGGFGAGGAQNKVHGEIVDAKTGDVLVRFTQERRSGGTMKFAGGSDDQVMRDSIHAIGEDVAHILDAFQ